MLWKLSLVLGFFFFLRFFNISHLDCFVLVILLFFFHLWQSVTLFLVQSCEHPHFLFVQCLSNIHKQEHYEINNKAEKKRCLGLSPTMAYFNLLDRKSSEFGGTARCWILFNCFRIWIWTGRAHLLPKWIFVLHAINAIC